MNIAVTGGIGCGKSTVCRVFTDFGIPVYSADKMCHNALQTKDVIDELTKNFGVGILNENAQINRTILAETVFDQPEKLAVLTSVLHRIVQCEIERLTAQKETKIIEVPLLYECRLEHMFDCVIAVWSPPDLCAERLKHWPPGQYEKRAKLQLSSDEKLEKADFGIINNNDISTLEQQCVIIKNKLHI